MLGSNGIVPSKLPYGYVPVDMDLERLPSGKFQTYELVLELAILSYNILRTIGQKLLGKRNPRLKRTVKRRRHRTVINNLVNMTCHITEHARKLVIGLGRNNIWREVFQHVYYAFEEFVLQGIQQQNI